MEEIIMLSMSVYERMQGAHAHLKNDSDYLIFALPNIYHTCFSGIPL